MPVRFLTTLIWLIWLSACAWVAAFRTPVTTDLTFFLPKDAGLLDAVLVQQMREGPASRLLLIAVDGAPQGELAETSRRLASRLKADSRFEAMENGSAGDMLQSLEGRLFPHRYALSPDLSPRRFETSALRTELESRLAELASPTGILQKDWLARDPTGQWPRLLRLWLAAEGPALKQGVWFSADGRRALLLARTRASGFDLGAQAEAQDAVRRAFEEVRPSPAVALSLGGAGMVGVEANARITRDAARLSVLNSALVLLLLFGVYRSFRVLGLGLVPLATGVLSGTAATSLAFGGIHGITLGFGATLVGVAADYPNHFFTHLSPKASPSAAMARIWPTLRLGVLTNVAGFAAMLFSGFSGLAQLAVFAGSGLLAAGLATRWVLPVLAGRGVRLPAWVERGSRGFSEIPARWAASRWLSLAVAACLATTFALSPKPVWNDDVAALNPASPARLAANEALGRDFGAPDLRQLVLVTAPDPEAALRLSESIAAELETLKSRGALASFDLAARYLPSRETQERRLAALPDAAALAVRLREAGRGLPFKPGLFEPFLQDVREASQRGPLTAADLAGTPFAAKVESLLFPLDESGSGGRDGGAGRKRDTLSEDAPESQRWAALIPLTGIADPDAVARALAPWKDRGVHFLDLREESTRLVRDYRREALHLLAFSLAAIVLILAAGLRSLPAALRVLAPVLLAGFCTALAMALFSGGLTLFHLVSLLLVLGLSLDQSLFFNRDAADPEERRRTLLSLLVCSASSVLAFGTLALSEVNILRSIGGTVALGALLAVCFAALLAQGRRVPA
jgi:predicted exporter